MNQKNLLFIIGMTIPLIIMIIVLYQFSDLSKPTEEENTKVVSLMEMEPYKNVNLTNPQKIEINKYTEGGLATEVVEDKDEITKITYNLLNMKIGKETNQACEDNTTVYVITTQDNETVKIEIECDWIIIKNKRFLIV